MLLTTEAVQVTKPKLARLSDAHAVHDPLVTSLDRPVPVSKLRDCHFQELSEKGLLSASAPSNRRRAAAQTVWWSTLGELCCTCDRGRLMEDAPCVHKLALAALSESWSSTAELPTQELLGRGARVERVCSDETGSYFALADNLQGPPSPQRRMVFRSSKGAWYCEGKRDGCPSVTDCSHVIAAKAALRNEGDLSVAVQMVLRLSEPLSEAALGWLKRWNGELPKIGVPPAVGTSSQGGGDAGLSEEERYLVGLLERRPHEQATCAGDSCFCRQHDRLFGEAAVAHTSNDRESNGGGRGREGGAAEEEAPPCKRARRNKAFWEAHKQGSQGSATRVTKPKLARPSDAHAVHDPLVTSLRSPVPVSELCKCHFWELSEKGLLSAPCPLDPPACGGSWVEAWIEADVTASQWSQRVRVRIYHCQCLDEAHTVHFCGEHQWLFTWNRRTLFVQESLQLLLRGMQHGHSFKAELTTHQSAFQRSPDAIVLSEETWRRASLDFFKLVGLGFRDCCSLCGPHPKILICDGIVGLASADGAQKPGGLGSSSPDARRTFCHPSRTSTGALLEKRPISGRDYCGSGLQGGGLKRKLLLLPELREALARLSQHRPRDEKLGKRLSKVEYEALLNGLAHEDPQIVKRFGPDEAEGPLPEDGRRRMLVEQRTMVQDRNLAVFELLT
ncbi:hypothetical protein KFL_016440020, partial [Klebsormidium nitens]